MIESVPLSQIPPLSHSASWDVYAWHQLPYAFPSLLTITFGLGFALLALYRAKHQPSAALRNKYQWFALYSLGLASLGFILVTRALIRDLAILQLIHNGTYLLTLLLAPMGVLFLNCISKQKFKILHPILYVTWFTVLIGALGLVQGKGFENQWNQYGFGLYPEGSIYIKPWEILSILFAATLFPFVLWKTYQAEENEPGEKTTLVGFGLSCLLICLNVPNLLGYAIYPTTNFMFISLLLMAWGVFHSEFRDANDLLFNKQGLFYFFSLLVSAAFVIAAILITMGLSPSLHSQSHLWPWGIPPLLSTIVAFALAVLVAGSNAKNSINIFCALALAGFGFFAAASFVTTLGLEPIVNLRINQLCILIWLPLAIIQYLFLFKVIREPPLNPKPFLVITALTIPLILTPLGLSGYYPLHSGDIIGTGSPIVSIWMATGVIYTGLFLIRWWKTRRTRKDPMADAIALATFVAIVMMVSNIPSTRGYTIYPFGNFIGIPLAMIGFAILRYGAMPISNRAITITRKLATISLTLLPLVGLLIAPALLPLYSLPEVALYLLILLSPVLLLGLLLMFIFARPIATELDTSYQDLTNAYEELKTAQGRLVEAEKMSSIGVMIAGIAHELNNPLAALQGEVTILRNELPTLSKIAPSLAQNLDESTGIQEKAASRMVAIIKGLRQYSREDRTEPELVNLRDIIDNTLAISSTRIKPVPVIITLAGGPEQVSIFPGKVSQVISNLVINAADACRNSSDPSVLIGSNTIDQELIIFVTDNGPGIPKDIQGKIFDPFFTTKDVGKGTGLGLALCKKFAQEMGGDLTLESRPGSTTFMLKLPIPK